MTCTCAGEDESGVSVTVWDGSTFTSQCPRFRDQIILAHSQFSLAVPIECGRISVVPISQDLQTYTSNATITVSTSNNGSSIRCSVGISLEGMIVLNVGGGFYIIL